MLFLNVFCSSGFIAPGLWYHWGWEIFIVWKGNIHVSLRMHFFLLPSPYPFSQQTPAYLNSFKINTLDLTAHLSYCQRFVLKIFKVKMALLNLEWLNRNCSAKPNVSSISCTNYKWITAVGEREQEEEKMC